MYLLSVPCDQHTHTAVTQSSSFPQDSFHPKKCLTTLSKSLSKQVYSHPALPLQSIGLALLLNPLRMCFGQLWNLCLLHICRQLQSKLNPTRTKHPHLSCKEFQRPSQNEGSNPSFEQDCSAQVQCLFSSFNSITVKFINFKTVKFSYKL